MSTSSPIELPLWPDGVPGEIAAAADDVPRMNVHLAGDHVAPCILVCPGGGYARRAPHEGEPVALWLNSIGIHAAVVHYRVSPYRHPHPLSDVVQAMRIARSRAGEWKIDATRVGVLGFSAGGHVASTACTMTEPADRPALGILLYPVITFRAPHAHPGSIKNLSPDDSDAAWLDRLSSDLHITPQTPPTFLFHTVSDPVVPVEHSLMYAAALRKNGVPFEMHLYETGRHGVGLAKEFSALSTWPMLCAKWLAVRGWTEGKPE